MKPYMPEVEVDCDIAECFRQARQMSAGVVTGPGEVAGERRVALITPGRLVMSIPCPRAGSVTEEMLAAVRGIIPGQPKQAITVIAFNDVVAQGALNIGQVNSLIPFLGYLMGMAFDGHTVVVFEGHAAALSAGCRDADLVIVDQKMAEHLPNNWVKVASRAMRIPRMLVLNRDGSIAEVDTTRSAVRVGDLIRAGQFAAAIGAAAEFQREAEHSRNPSERIHVELTSAAKSGLTINTAGLAGVRDAGRVDRAMLDAFNGMLVELTELVRSKGVGSVSRFNMAYFLVCASQLMSALSTGKSPEEMAEDCEQFGEVADAFQMALDQCEPVPHYERKRRRGNPWWKFW